MRESASNSSPSGAGEDVIKTKKFTEQTIVITPGESQSLGLGAYDISVPMPVFEVIYSPQIAESMGASLERLDIPGKTRYIAVYHFHNFSDVPCSVTVRMHK
jgi:hypothetical protein